jgi:aminopeptidase S
MYRGTWLLVGLPLLITAFSVAKAPSLPPPSVSTTFDRAAAVGLAQELSQQFPDRRPGTRGDRAAAGWIGQQLVPYGIHPVSDRFSAHIPGVGRVGLENLVAEIPGPSKDAIVVMAHRDNSGKSPGVNDNASGSAALIELARTFAEQAAAGAAARPQHTLVFVSSDGGTAGALGAARFATSSPYRGRIIAVVDLDAIAGSGRPSIQLAGQAPRSPAAALVETAAIRLRDTTGSYPGHPGALSQLIDLAFPFSLYEQAPFVGRGIPAVTLTTAGARPPTPVLDTSLHTAHFGQIGQAAQSLVGSLDQGLELAQSTSTYIYFAGRAVRGWAIELSLVAMLLPFLAATVDLFARCRRRRIPLAPAFRSYRSRLGFWLLAAALFELFALLGAWPGGSARPIDPGSPPAGDWPVLGLALLFGVVGVGWLVTRERLLPRRPTSTEETLSGYTAALLALAIVGLLIVATNPFALIFVLPSMHAWLWLPQASGRSLARLALYLAGFAGPLLLLGSFALRFGLGLDAPWYLAELTAVGYVSLWTVFVWTAWLASAGQVAALAAGRYAPYPNADERPRRGPLRSGVRRLLIAAGVRSEPAARRRAVGE